MKLKLKSVIKTMILLFLLTSLFLVVYISFIERNLLVCNEYEITINKNAQENMRVVQFSDTQLGEYYTLDNLEKAVNKINKLNADIVVFTGDLIDNASIYDDLFNVSDVLKEIKATTGKYAIYGNHDYGGGAVRYYESIMNESGFTVLKNNSASIEINGHTVNIFGGDDALMGGHNAEKTVSNINEKDVNLLLIHEPDIVDEYSEYPIDLVLSGHSHGGQVYIPFYGPAKKTLLSEKYNRGLFQLNNSRDTVLYVNTGLGNTKFPFRFLTIPEISVFDIKF